MKKQVALKEETLQKFERRMRAEECEESTIEVYVRTIRKFASWVGCEKVCKEDAIEWKRHLSEVGYTPVTVNAKLAALNKFFTCMGCECFKVRYLRVQRRVFRAANRELTRPEYQRLLSTAQAQGKHRLSMLMETICATGIRVSEVKYITVEAARSGMVEVALKGKVRTILLPNKLCRKPKSGLFLRAAKEWNIDLKQSVMYGDKESDRISAEQAGIGAFYTVYCEKNI